MVPPEKQLNKDFLKKVLTNEKKLLHISQVKFINVPHYNELSVKTFWPRMQQDAEFMKYMPDPTPDGRLPDRNYFWNVLNTIHPDYMKNVLAYANDQRMAAKDVQETNESIKITDEWFEKLTAIPFISCKCTSQPFNLCLQSIREKPCFSSSTDRNLCHRCESAGSFQSSETMKSRNSQPRNQTE